MGKTNSKIQENDTNELVRNAILNTLRGKKERVDDQ